MIEIKNTEFITLNHTNYEDSHSVVKNLGIVITITKYNNETNVAYDTFDGVRNYFLLFKKDDSEANYIKDSLLKKGDFIITSRINPIPGSPYWPDITYEIIDGKLIEDKFFTHRQPCQ